MIYDLVIIGAGMFGSAAARHASVNPSLKIALIGPEEPQNEEEKQKREILSSHYDEGRITRVLDEQIACQNLGEESIKRYEEIETFSGMKFYHPVGLVAFGQKGGKNIEDVRQAVTMGRVSVLELNSNELRKRYPFLKFKDDDLSFLDENGAGHISPRIMVSAQQKICRMQGVQFIRDVVSEVKPLKEKDGIFYHEVVTENGSCVLSKRVLISAGAFVNLKKLIPTEDGRILDVKMIPDTAAMVRIPAEEAQRLKTMPSLIYYGPNSEDASCYRAYAIPPIKYPNGDYIIKIGHLGCDPELKTSKDVRDWYSSQGNPKIVETRSKLLQELLPGLKVEEVKGLACAICCTPSALPYIDRVTPTLSVAVAGNGKGAKFSDEVGRLGAHLALYGRWDSELPRSMFKIQWKTK